MFGYSRSSSECDEMTENKANSQQELSFIDSNSQTTDKSKTNVSWFYFDELFNSCRHAIYCLLGLFCRLFLLSP